MASPARPAFWDWLGINKGRKMLNLYRGKFPSLLIAGLALALLVGCAGGASGGRPSKKNISNDKQLQVYLQLGEAMLLEGEYTGALNQLSEAQALAPNNPLVYSNLAMAYLGKREFALAEENIKKALALNPRMTDAHNNLGLIYMEQGRYGEAMDEFNKCLADITFQGAYRVHNNIGIIHLEKGEPQEALKFFKASMNLAPQYSVAYNNLGRAYMDMGQYQDALDALNMATRITPKYIQAYMNLGETYEHLGYYSEASDMYNKVVSLAGNSPIALEAQSRVRRLSSRP